MEDQNYQNEKKFPKYQANRNWSLWGFSQFMTAKKPEKIRNELKKYPIKCTGYI